MDRIIDLVSQMAAFITASGIVLAFVKKWLVEPTNNKIDTLELSSVKTDFVNFINDVEHDVRKSQIQKLNAHELYDRYTKLGGNSYVHEHWEKLSKEGKI